MPERDSDPRQPAPRPAGGRHARHRARGRGHRADARRPPAATGAATTSSASSCPEFGAGLGLQGGDRQSARRATATASPCWWCSRPTASSSKLRMPLDVYLGIVAATNMKQRTRKQIEYYHADRLNYAVLGTPNRLEYDQGFFVKNGDGAADLKPIAHLYKTQVYQLAEHLGVPEEIRRRPPTTDTWSLAQTQEEFYFSLPYREMDLCLYGLNNGVPADAVAQRGRADRRAGRAGLARHRGQAPDHALSARAAAAGRAGARGGRQTRRSVRIGPLSANGTLATSQQAVSEAASSPSQCASLGRADSCREVSGGHEAAGVHPPCRRCWQRGRSRRGRSRRRCRRSAFSAVRRLPA